jgi:hypothetical protein
MRGSTFRLRLSAAALMSGAHQLAETLFTDHILAAIVN